MRRTENCISPADVQLVIADSMHSCSHRPRATYIEAVRPQPGRLTQRETKVYDMFLLGWAEGHDETSDSVLSGLYKLVSAGSLA